MRTLATALAVLVVSNPLVSHGFYVLSPISRQSIARGHSCRLQKRSRTSMKANKSSTRQDYFAQLLYKSVATVALSGASSLVMPPGISSAYDQKQSTWQPKGDPKTAGSWFPLVGKCYEALEDVITNWEKYTVRQDGDAIRRMIGTVGVSSPLSSLRKAFVSIRDAEEESQEDFDVMAYVEAYMEVLTALGDAENDLYSANFADYSGGGGTKGSQFIVKANKSLKIARDHFKEVNSILGI
ncbi:unnamed protein product [Ascophyllum nodosum]